MRSPSASALGPDHPDVATSTSNLAYLLHLSGRTADALPFAEKILAGDRAQFRVVLPILFAARQQSLLPDDKAVDEALAAVQRGTQSSAASAVNKLAVRLAAGTDRLAELVRKDQDLAAESEALDKAIITAVSKQSAQRDVPSEQRSRARIAAIASEPSCRRRSPSNFASMHRRRTRAAGVALGGQFRSCHPPDHFDSRSAQQRTNDRQGRSSAAPDVNIR